MGGRHIRPQATGYGVGYIAAERLAAGNVVTIISIFQCSNIPCSFGKTEAL